MLRKLLIAILFVSVCGTGVARATSEGFHRHRELRVMTRNMDAGSDFWYVLAAVQNPQSTQQDLLVAITKTYLEMHGSNIPKRAAGIAREIGMDQPDLVGLQEVTVLTTGPYGEAPTVVLDSGLDSLLTALAQRGLHYAPVIVQKNAQIVLPALDATFQQLIDVGLVDYDVILARTDLPTSEFKLENTQAAHFTAILNFPVAGQTIPFLRGWLSVDAKLRGKSYRFVTTHLETFQNDYQAAQAEELLMGPLNTDLPVVLAGDLNSDAHTPSYANGPAYGILTSGGLHDLWILFHVNDGYTWPMYVEDSGIGPHDPQRIDLILIRGDGMQPVYVWRTGTSPIHGLWSSDHTGVAATIWLKP